MDGCIANDTYNAPPHGPSDPKGLLKGSVYLGPFGGSVTFSLKPRTCSVGLTPGDRGVQNKTLLFVYRLGQGYGMFVA